MSRDQDLKGRFSIAWETSKPGSPGLSASSRCSVFFALGSEWYLEMSSHASSTFYQIFLFKVDEEPLEKPFRVTTFIETDANFGLPLLPSVTTVESAAQIIWSRFRARISECFPQFYSGYRFKIVCMFHDGLPSAPQNVNGTVNMPTLMIFDDPRSCSRQDISNVPNRTMSSDKSVQVSLEFSPDLESLSMDFGKMLENKDIPDVQLRCRNHTFPAHRAVLAARSEVFAAMFRNQMLESETGIVDIDDLNAPTLELVLKYLYSGKIPSVSDDVVLKLYAAADKYALLLLKKACSERIVGSLTEENCLDFLALADTYSDKEFKDAVVNFILGNLWILKGQAWSSFKEKYPELAFSVYDFIVTQKCFSV